jgi:hypothetical protein
MPGTGVGGMVTMREGAHMQVDDADDRHELATVADPVVVRESLTMGLYITISLLAVLSAEPHGGGTSAVLTLVWGTTVGLALAHWFAFQLTARLFAGSRLPSHDRMTMVGQAVAALGVGVLASVPLLLHENAGPALSRGVLAGLIGLFAFGAARHHGGSFGSASAYALVVVTIALAVVIGKYLITGH